MAYKARKQNETVGAPPVALFSQATWVTQQLDQASARQIGQIARKIVHDFSDRELRALPADLRQRLLSNLKNGRITQADRKAVDKLLTAELVEVRYREAITIKGTGEFAATTQAHLSLLAKLSIGRKLLDSICQSGKSVTIIHTDRVSEAPPNDFKAAIPKGKTLKWFDLWGHEKTIRGTGKGSDTIIKYNPTFTCSHQTKDWNHNPPEISLAHELIHAHDSAYGRLDPDEVDGVRNYERQAVGLAPYENKEFTENKFRQAWSKPLPLRMRY
ncbi:MAG: hypothetical protein JNK38_19125 [Acidobacteria bacterium]|nr:hypothetical protein [Acidobacteriota bacterium]